MRGSVFALALMGLHLSGATALAQRGFGQDGVRHGWLGSLESGKAEARRSGKPLMVVIRCVP